MHAYIHTYITSWKLTFSKSTDIYLQYIRKSKTPLPICSTGIKSPKFKCNMLAQAYE